LTLDHIPDIQPMALSPDTDITELANPIAADGLRVVR